MRVKICGITNLQDALWAVEAGADALGFVFYKKSPRYIKPEDAKQIISSLPPFVQSVGLFVNEDVKIVNKVCKENLIDLAQIHFEATEQFYKDLEVKHLKVVRAKNKEDILRYKDEYKIVDAFVPQYGGEGKRVALEWFEGIDCSKIILAGGLNIDNIDQLKDYNFYSLDLSSGVEEYKGKKSKQKIVSFMKKVDEIFR